MEYVFQKENRDGDFYYEKFMEYCEEKEEMVRYMESENYFRDMFDIVIAQIKSIETTKNANKKQKREARYKRQQEEIEREQKLRLAATSSVDAYETKQFLKELDESCYGQVY
jgi:hypothetical protein